MPRITLEQPDGKFCIFSTVVDNFIATDMTEDELLAERIQGAVEEAIYQHRRWKEQHEQGIRVGFIKTYEDACATRDRVHGVLEEKG